MKIQLLQDLSVMLLTKELVPISSLLQEMFPQLECHNPETVPGILCVRLFVEYKR
ncbi:hypothetical protein [Lactococcus lactis]|uniref:hypothetical protein n=1 Tax=Lactococcus lactis TaxID=1358 RepID=UPI002905973B|nr:hypothetical protein [Lactococcus lactis]